MGAAVVLVLVELGADRRRQVAERVDLAVQVAERRADLDAVVLERHHVVVAVGPERRRALAQHGDEVDQLRRRQLGERCQGVVGGVDDHLAPTGRAGGQPVPARDRRRGHRREAVVEHGDLERPRQLGAPRTQRARLADRPTRRAADDATGALVARRRHQDPAAGEPVEPPSKVGVVVVDPDLGRRACRRRCRRRRSAGRRGGAARGGRERPAHSSVHHRVVQIVRLVDHHRAPMSVSPQSRRQSNVSVRRSLDDSLAHRRPPASAVARRWRSSADSGVITGSWTPWAASCRPLSTSPSSSQSRPRPSGEVRPPGSGIGATR